YLKIESLLGIGGNSLATALDETPDVREVLLNKTKERMDEAQETLERFVKLNPHGDGKNSPLSEEVASLREQIETVRVYSRSDGASRFAEGEPYTAKEVTTKVIFISRPEPLYTERARQDQVTGAVRLRMVLAADGTVKYIFAVRRLPDGLTESAINAAHRIKFIPAVKDGHPVSQFVTIEYNFNIY
ncbi:MAG: energy transducer TonB, partial [Acidobacteria bacterium]|nr:energy transducer TonB [Acidobacteriota bacterium]